MEYFQLRQPYDYHSAVPGYNIPITDKTELLTTPIDTGITKHNSDPTIINASGNDNIVKLDPAFIDFGTTNTSKINQFKVGDYISIIISSYCSGDGDTGTEYAGKGPSSGARREGASADARNDSSLSIGETEFDVTSSKSSFHRVTNVDSTNKKVYFNPPVTAKNNNNNLINSLSVGSELGDHLYVFILGRVQQKESRCSKLAKNINVYSFSLRPEDHQPSGTCNFSRIDTARLITGTDLSSDDNIYGVNYNILRIMSGMGGVAYSN